MSTSDARVRLTLPTLVLVLLASSSRADPPGGCLPDAIPFDGHPMFGSLHFRTSLPDVEPTTGNLPRATGLALDDLDGDQVIDAVVVNVDGEYDYDTGQFTGPSNIGVLLNGGDGVFDQVVNYPMGIFPTSAATGDLDGDGDADIAVTNGQAHTVTVVFNNGNGQFSGSVAYPTGQNPRSVVIDHFDADSYLDMAVANADTDDVTVLLNQGDGTFAVSGSYPAGNVLGNYSTAIPQAGPLSASADLDGDNDIDLAVPAQYYVSVLLNNGDGTFAPLAQYPVTGKASAVAIGDLDQQQGLDLVVANQNYIPSGQVVSVLLNNGDGTFADQVTYSVIYASPGTYWPLSVALADPDEDGDLDIAVGLWNYYRVLVLENNGDGSFAEADPASTYEVGLDPQIVSFADANADGRVDLLDLDRGGGRYSLGVLLGVGDGTFLNHETTPERLPGFYELFPWGFLKLVAAVDLDGDEGLDLAMVSRGAGEDPGAALVLLNLGDATFTEPTAYALGDPYYNEPVAIAVGDLNGDEAPDLAVGDHGPTYDPPFTQGCVWVLLNNGDGSFGSPVSYPFPAYLGVLAIGDVDGDQDRDLAVTDWEAGQMWVLFNNGDASFTQGTPYHVGTYPRGVIMAHLNADQALDIAVANCGGSGTGDVSPLSILLNNGDGTFVVTETVEIPGRPEYLAAADLDHDTDLDLAVSLRHANLGEGTPSYSIFFNDGAGAFPQHVDYTLPGTGMWHSVVAADLDADCDLDLAFANSGRWVAVAYNHGDGTFAPAVNYGAGGGPEGIVVGDFDEDGDLDLVTSNNGDGNYSVLRNRRCSYPLGDLDRNGAVNLSDFATFALCYTGASATTLRADCTPTEFCGSDLDGDDDVDLSDFATFALHFTG